MSQENVEIVRRANDAWNREDLEGLLALSDPEIEYVNSPDRGRAGHEARTRRTTANPNSAGPAALLTRKGERRFTCDPTTNEQ